VLPDYPLIQTIVHEILEKYKSKGILMVDRLDNKIPNLEYTHNKKKAIDPNLIDQRNQKILDLEKKIQKSMSMGKKKEYAR